MTAAAARLKAEMELDQLNTALEEGKNAAAHRGQEIAALEQQLRENTAAAAQAENARKQAEAEIETHRKELESLGASTSDVTRQREEASQKLSDNRMQKLRTEKDGKSYWTPMLIVFLTIGTTDVMFAFDSIPAIFGLTKDPFIVFTSNVFALLGLQQLYFLLGALLDKLVYLPVGLAFVLGFIGIKLVMEALSGNTLPFINGGHPVSWVPEVPTWVSLVVIVVAIGSSAIASVMKMKSVEAAKSEA